MASTYVNDLRLEEIATGEQSGTWGDTTNTNLELIAEAFGFGTEAITTNADTHTTTIADGATDPGRSMFLKYTGTLDSACTITIAPNTVSKLWFIENGTSGSQNIIISQGSGANITIPPGDTKAIYSDGAGSGAAMVDAFASLSVVDLKVQDDLTVTDDMTVGGTLGVTGVLTTTATQVATGGITSGSNIVSDTDSTDDLGTTGTRWANLFVDAITATDQITATGFTGTLDGILGSGSAAAATVTTLNTSGAVNLNLTTDSTSSTSGALIVDGGVGIAKKLFVGTDLDVDGTTNLDIVDIDGAVNMATTALVTGVLTTTAATVFNGGFALGGGVGGFTDGSVSAPSITFSGDTDTGMFRPAANSISITTNGVESLRVNSLANVGFFGDGGVEAIDHYTAYTTLTLSNATGAIIQFEDDGNMIGELFNGTDHFTVGSSESGASLRFRAGDAAEVMRIISTGKVGIGNTLPLGKLTISNGAGANAPTSVTAANTYLQLGSDDYGASNNGKFMVGFGFTDATNTNSPAYIGFEETSTSGDTKGDLTFYTRDVFTDTLPLVRLRIAANGSLSTPTLGTSNVRLGVNAGDAIVSGGQYNVCIGDEAGTAISTGDANTLVGYEAGNAIVDTLRNTMMGYRAGKAATGSGNSENVYIGNEAAAVITSGIRNTIVGGSAGSTLVGANSDNTFLGQGAGATITSGDANTMVGRFDGNQNSLDLRTAANCIVLSDGDGNPRHFINAATNHGFSTIDFNTSNGSVGNIYAYEAASNNIVNVYHLNTSDRNAIFEVRRNGRTNERMAQINLGENASSQGTITIFSSAANADVTGGVTMTNGATSWSSASDIRLKTITGTYDNALQDIAKIEPIKFTWKADSTNQANVGVSAQSVQEVVPEAVIAMENSLTPEDETKYLSVKYTELIPLMIASIQELSAKNDALEARIATLEG